MAELSDTHKYQLSTILHHHYADDQRVAAIAALVEDGRQQPAMIACFLGYLGACIPAYAGERHSLKAADAILELVDKLKFQISADRGLQITATAAQDKISFMAVEGIALVANDFCEANVLRRIAALAVSQDLQVA